MEKVRYQKIYQLTVYSKSLKMIESLINTWNFILLVFKNVLLGSLFVKTS